MTLAKDDQAARSRMKQNILKGALYGCWAWLAWGIAGLVLSIGTQLHYHHDVQLMGWQWPLIARLFGVWAVGGLLLGMGCGLLLTWRNQGQIKGAHQLTALLTVVLAFILDVLSTWPLKAAEYVGLAVGVSLAVAFSLALVSQGWRRRIQPLNSAWIVSLLLVAAPWMSPEGSGSDFSSIVKKFFLLAAALLLISLWNRSRETGRMSLRRQVGLIAVIAGVALPVIAGAALIRTFHREPATAGPASLKPNVVLITMDTVRADHLSIYGYGRETTPYLKQFAHGATFYSRAVSTSDYTLVTHASIFTGLYPSWHGASYSLPLPPDLPTLPALLRDHGYDTMESVGNAANLAPWTGLTRGFTVAEWTVPVTITSRDHPLYPQEGARRFLAQFTNASAFDRSLRTASDITQRAETLLAQAKTGGRPFFLFLNYIDAHSPRIPEAPFDKRFSDTDPHFRPPDYAPIWTPPHSQLTVPEQLNAVALYDDAIAAEDTAIGNVLQQLRALGLYENTLVIITADHGEALGERGLLGHASGTLYQNVVGIPLLIKYPQRDEAMQSDRLVSQVDLLPTILDVVGIAPPAFIQGRSLLREPSPESEIKFAEASPSPNQLSLGNPRVRGVRRAIFSGSLKLITWSHGPTELYDLASDPYEQHDLYRSDDVRAIDLSKRLADWAAHIPHRVRHTKRLEKSDLDRLKSLGYVQ
jgi:arylsulfatase A-like enzyme